MVADVTAAPIRKRRLASGTVMRMVAEEVHLRRLGQQRPRVNETLTRLILLGGMASNPTGDDGAIPYRGRQLLLSITDLPQSDREQVETVAQAAGVPLHAPCWLSRALGREMPTDMAATERLMVAEAQRVCQPLDERRTLDSENPEIRPLAALARQALQHGALDADVDFRERARARYRQVPRTFDETERQLRTRRLEGGEVLANTAVAHGLKADADAVAGLAFMRRDADRWAEAIALSAGTLRVSTHAGETLKRAGAALMQAHRSDVACRSER